MLEPTGGVCWNREKEKTWTLLFAPGSQTNFAECPNVQKLCTGNITADSLLSVDLIYACRFENIQCARRVMSCKNQHRCWRTSHEVQEEMGRVD